MSNPDVFHRTSLSDLRMVAEAVAEHAPELLSRTEKALGILLSGKVARVSGDVLEVLAGDDRGSYRVDLAEQSCDCPDFRHRGVEHRGRRWCKHLIAARILTKLQARKRPGARQARVASFRRHVRRPVVRRTA